MVVDPDAECDPNKRRKGYGPANKTEHPKTKPDASRFTALCCELASLLHTQLIGDDRWLRSPRIVVHSPQFDAAGSEHSDRLSTHIMMTSLRSKWAAGCRRVGVLAYIGVRGSKTVFRSRAIRRRRFSPLFEA